MEIVDVKTFRVPLGLGFSTGLLCQIW